jgi:uncharacterized protein YheU (UPF0270 family)
MEIPWERLSADTLHALIEDFVTREGTEYGATEVTLERKVEQVLAQLRSGEAYITYDKQLGTATIHRRGVD